MSDVIVIQSDGMDQSKFRLPRDPRLQAVASSALSKHPRPRITVHGIWAYGFLSLNWESILNIFLDSNGFQSLIKLSPMAQWH